MQRDVVRFVFDVSDARKQKRLAEEKELRKRERIILLEQMLTATLMGWILVWASGIFA